MEKEAITASCINTQEIGCVSLNIHRTPFSYSGHESTTLYVDPATLPAGPFLAYDHQGHLVSSIYMIPLKDMNAQKAFSGLKVAHAVADHVDIVYNAGHPGVAEPHYHIVVWYISAQRAAQLAK